MKLPRRRFLHLAAGAVALPAVSRFARAQAYPSRPVRLVVGAAAGGGVDIVGRLIGQWLSERLGQQFIIENRPGAGTNIATEAVVRAPADGYTLLLVNPANAINATLYDRLSFNFIADVAPVAGISRVPNVMVVNPSLPANTVPEFIAYAKANAGKLNFASGGRSDRMAVELFMMMTGINMAPPQCGAFLFQLADSPRSAHEEIGSFGKDAGGFGVDHRESGRTSMCAGASAISQPSVTSPLAANKTRRRLARRRRCSTNDANDAWSQSRIAASNALAVAAWEMTDAAAGVHRGARERGGVASRGTGAAGRPRAAGGRPDALHRTRY
jgi:hypothetical protein